MVKYYKELHLLKRKMRNEEMWIQGMYTMNAFAVVLGNAFSKGKKQEYLKEPLDILPKTKAEKEEEKRKETNKLVEWLDGLRKSFKKPST